MNPSPFAANNSRSDDETMHELLGEQRESGNKDYGYFASVVFLPVPNRRRGGGPKPLTIEEKVARFWSRMQRVGECLLWTGGCTPDGYGLVSLGRLYDGRQVNEYCHRVAYRLRHGPIPPELLIRHRCDVPNCCEDTHHLLGTVADNAEDARVQGHYNVPRPHRRWDEEPYASILRQILNGPRGTALRLSRHYRIPLQTIYKAVRAEREQVSVTVRRIA